MTPKRERKPLITFAEESAPGQPVEQSSLPAVDPTWCTHCKAPKVRDKLGTHECAQCRVDRL